VARTAADLRSGVAAGFAIRAACRSLIGLKQVATRVFKKALERGERAAEASPPTSGLNDASRRFESRRPGLKKHAAFALRRPSVA
jgi:hypothetical protein